MNEVELVAVGERKQVFVWQESIFFWLLGHIPRIANMFTFISDYASQIQNNTQELYICMKNKTPVHDDTQAGKMNFFYSFGRRIQISVIQNIDLAPHH